MNARRLRGPVFVIAALAVAACSAILGIEDRFPEPTGADASDGSPAESEVSTNTDGATGESDASIDVPIIPDAMCNTDACATVGGTCNGACVIPCKGADCNRTIACPADTDCQIICDGKSECTGARCTGGRSCSFECTGDTSCYGTSCESAACRFNCAGPSACKEGVLACDAGTCAFDCSGTSSCETGILARGETTCAIACTGESSCGRGGVPRFSCTALEASVVCGPTASTCKDGLPTCSGGSCKITCDPVCPEGYCCDAAICSATGTGTKLCL